jgi:serine/threonine protein kinase
MPLSAGTRLGPYEILAPLGAGGMGEVYRARDAKLDRDVAVKVLPASIANFSAASREAQDPLHPGRISARRARGTPTYSSTFPRGMSQVRPPFPAPARNPAPLPCPAGRPGPQAP